MSAQFKTLLTEFGAAKLAEIQATNAPLNLQYMAIGDGGGQAVEPSSDQTSLVNETHRAQINTLAQDSNNDSYYIAELVVPADVGGWYVREIGLYDDQGNLFAAGNVPETYKPLLSSGSSRDQVFRMIVEIGSNANVTLKIDPAMVLATRAYVDTRDDTKLDKILRSDATNSNSSETVATSKALNEVFNLANSKLDISSFQESLIENGWSKLPNGLIIQWGIKNQTASAGSVTFPIQFPNSCFFAITDIDERTNMYAFSQAIYISKTGFAFATYGNEISQPPERFEEAHKIYYLAIGY